MSVIDDDFRSTFSTNYYQNNTQSSFDVSHSHSINTIQSMHSIPPGYLPYLSEELVAGQRINGKMSNVRRFFCMFVTFDFLFVGLMWIICVMLDGEYLIKALSEQIVHYNIKTSLFDIVLLAFARFLLLIIFYALVYINHWIVISISTTLTCIFLIAKVFLFDWPHSSQPIFEVLLVLASFVLSWGEAWFLDFRVLPQELHASRYLISGGESERAPLIRRYLNGLPHHPHYTEESERNFYSPQVSPSGSLSRFNQAISSKFPVVKLTREQEDEYKKQGIKAVDDAWAVFQKTDWKLEKQKNSDLVYSRKEPKMGKIFKLECEINTSPRFVLDELYYRVQDIPKWNKAVKESHKIQIIDEHTDILYIISADGAKGLVSSRDFVNIRHWIRTDDAYVIGYKSCNHPSAPAGEYIRAENSLGLWVLQHIPNEADKCKFSWLLHSNLKLSMPNYILNKEIIEMMFKYANDLREYVIKSDYLSQN